MTIQVHIDDRFERNGLDIHVFDRLDSTHVLLYKPQGPNEVVVVHEASVMPVAPFHIPRDAAGPLFAALGRLLGSVENPEMLRKDYEAERKRVDRLIDAVIR
jgi:hypothetical protein